MNDVHLEVNSRDSRSEEKISTKVQHIQDDTKLMIDLKEWR